MSRVWLISGRASSVLGQLCGKWPPEKVLGSVSFVSRCLDLPTGPQGFPDHLTNCRTIRLIVRLFSCAPLWTPVSTCLSAVRTPPPAAPPHHLLPFFYLTRACSWLLVFPTCSRAFLLSAGRSFDLHRKKTPNKSGPQPIMCSRSERLWRDGVLS